MRGFGKCLICGVFAVALVACGDDSAPPMPDAPSGAIDGGQADAPPAMPDGGTAMAPKPAREVVSGGGRLTGGSMTMDVQVGHPYGQQKISGGTTTVEGGAAVKP